MRSNPELQTLLIYSKNTVYFALKCIFDIPNFHILAEF